MDWKSIGYSAAIASAQHSLSRFPYPTQDRYTPQDERDYYEGYAEGKSDYRSRGIMTLSAYASEKSS